MTMMLLLMFVALQIMSSMQASSPYFTRIKILTDEDEDKSSRATQLISKAMANIQGSRFSWKARRTHNVPAQASEQMPSVYGFL